MLLHSSLASWNYRKIELGREDDKTIDERSASALVPREEYHFYLLDLAFSFLLKLDVLLVLSFPSSLFFQQASRLLSQQSRLLFVTHFIRSPLLWWASGWTIPSFHFRFQPRSS